MKKIIFLVCFLSSCLVFSQKNDKKLLIEKALKYLKIDNQNLMNDFVSTKKYGEERTLILLPEINKYNSNCEECFSVNNNILIWNNNTEIFEYKYVKKNEWQSDAFYLTTLELDTANYEIKNNLRAFGIRYSFNGSSKVNPAGKTYFNLYSPENNEIKEIIHEFTIKAYNGESNGGCETLSMNTEKSILIISKKNTNNYKNIIVKTEFEKFHYDDDCDKKIITENYSESSIFKYRNGKYILE